MTEGIQLVAQEWLLLAIPLIALVILISKRNIFSLSERQDSSLFTIIFRGMAVLLIVIALSHPVQISRGMAQVPPTAKILVDTSDSMKVFDTSFVQGLEEEISKELPLDSKAIANGTESRIGDAIMASLSEQSSVLVISDGRVTEGAGMEDAGLLASKLNATISAVKLLPAVRDAGVTITAPQKTAKDVETQFLVEVNGIEGGNRPEGYRIEVEVDGQKIKDETTSEKSFVFSRRFESEGSHVIRVKVHYDNDYFPGNNEFFRTIKVVGKPYVAYVGNRKNPLLDLLGQLYTVDALDNVPDRQQLEKYHAVVLNDMPAKEVNNIDALKDYAASGNGLAVVGGFSSFEFGDYRNSPLEALLPVKVGQGAERRGTANVILLIDISGSTTGSTARGATIVDVEKALAVNIVDVLSLRNSAGAVAFNTESYIVSDFEILRDGKDRLVSRISRLKNGGGTSISTGLGGAYRMLKGRQGSNNIILISDGEYNFDLDKEKSLQIAKLLKDEGIKLYTIGVGANHKKQFLSELASRTNGIYLSADETNKLSVVFGEQGELPKGSTFDLLVLDSNHFITRDLHPRPLLDAYNKVLPKEGSRLLVTTSNGEPALTVWRYGLGRVSSLNVFSSGNNLGQLLAKENSKLVTRMVNWNIGDPERKLEEAADAADARIGETVTITVRTKGYPKSNLTFFRSGENTYIARTRHQQAGIYSVETAKYAVSYEKEYENLGMDRQLESIVQFSGGKIFNHTDANSILEHFRTAARKEQIVENNISWLFLLTGMLVYLAEVALRRLGIWKNIFRKA